jgi:hypothetical protein
MKAHNAVIYHCQCCGRILHQSSEPPPPVCCGVSMTPAVVETVAENDSDSVHSATAPGSAHDESACSYPPQKPR